jgi:hypothetical protein
MAGLGIPTAASSRNGGQELTVRVALGELPNG